MHERFNNCSDVQIIWPNICIVVQPHTVYLSKYLLWNKCNEMTPYLQVTFNGALESVYLLKSSSCYSY